MGEVCSRADAIAQNGSNTPGTAIGGADHPPRTIIQLFGLSCEVGLSRPRSEPAPRTRCRRCAELTVVVLMGIAAATAGGDERAGHNKAKEQGANRQGDVKSKLRARARTAAQRSSLRGSVVHLRAIGRALAAVAWLFCRRRRGGLAQRLVADALVHEVVAAAPELGRHADHRDDRGGDRQPRRVRRQQRAPRRAARSRRARARPTRAPWSRACDATADCRARRPRARATAPRTAATAPAGVSTSTANTRHGTLIEPTMRTASEREKSPRPRSWRQPTIT